LSAKQLTRADVEIRWAVAGDEDALARLNDTGPWPVQWPGCTKGWLVADVGGEAVACVQVFLGEPFGYVGHLAVDERLSPRERHLVMVELSRVACVALKHTGSQVIQVFCDFANKGFKRVLKKRFGGRVTASGNNLTAWLGE